jgi:hypothetical protein
MALGSGTLKESCSARKAMRLRVPSASLADVCRHPEAIPIGLLSLTECVSPPLSSHSPLSKLSLDPKQDLRFDLHSPSLHHGKMVLPVANAFGELRPSRIKFMSTNPGSVQAPPRCSISLTPEIAVVPPRNPAKPQNLDDRPAQCGGTVIPSQKRHSRPHPLLLRKFEGSSWAARTAG